MAAPASGTMAIMRVLDLTGLTVIVTGASSGIGASTARLLHEAGAHPVLAARRADRLERLSDELAGALAVPTDVTAPTTYAVSSAQPSTATAASTGSSTTPASAFTSRLDRLDLDEFTRVLALNVVSVVAMTQAVLPTMRREGQGRIVNVSSGTTRSVLPGVGGYAATKAALNMLTAVARKELEPDGIAVSLVVPSITATEFAGGRYQPGQQTRPGMIAHHPDYVGRVILRALRTGEEPSTSRTAKSSPTCSNFPTARGDRDPQRPAYSRGPSARHGSAGRRSRPLRPRRRDHGPPPRLRRPGVVRAGRDLAGVRGVPVHPGRACRRPAGTRRPHRLRRRHLRLVEPDRGRVVDDPGTITDSRLTGLTWTNGALRDVEFRGCRIDLAAFRFTSLRDVAFIDCNLAGADFTHADLRGAAFTDCSLTGAQFAEATTAGARFVRCDLAGIGSVTNLRAPC